MQKSMLKNGLLLGLFALICTAVVAVVNDSTRDAILAQQKLELRRTLEQIIPNELHDNPLEESCILLQDKDALGTTQPMPAYIATQDAEPVAIAIETIAPDGYNGEIRLIIGIKTDGTVLGVRTLSHQETPGLGDKIERKKSDWVDRFIGKKLQGSDDKAWYVKKDGGEIDQFTGATITPRAYVKSMRNTLAFFEANKKTIFSQSQTCEASQ
ncbi:electron transport complex subunit RsxG [Shewanella algae]|uniref:Ion-translocating oxidoreductase complex subunit G n=3 Tax=Bacteria TaxID=2 RepID=A0AAU6VX02_UNCXX|nr:MULTISPECIES: electron transport complex subunit RsxG [Shewanella]MBO2662688.1 electron transport complex subunit RsxG [Shewanella algae]MCL1053467.1 electron transport complex subunit RsxG [Shewanella algae]MCT8979428.1 electron transport complex subunit RsxG [Shewanella algae]MDE0567431.1 electron transport complex subunit RsxG [Shewanella sp. K8]BCV41063.1 electron transport complex subunit G [Shewanella algae]